MDVRAVKRQSKWVCGRIVSSRERAAPMATLGICARTRAARTGGTLDRAARQRWPTFPPGYGHAVRPWLLPRYTCCEGLERAPRELTRGTLANPSTREEIAL